jgi:hypothetical protein
VTTVELIATPELVSEGYFSAGTFTAEGPGETKVWLTASPEVRDYHTLLITEHSAQDDTTPRGVISVVHLLSVRCNDLVSIRSSIYYVYNS